MTLNLVPVTPMMDSNRMAAVISSNFRQLENLNRVQIFKDETGVNRIILGRLPDGSYGMKVSQEGVDVTEATDAELILDTSNNLFKIVDTGELTVTKAVNSESAVGSVSHDLGYAPLVIAFVVPFAGFSAGPTQTPAMIVETSGTNAGRVKYLANIDPGAAAISFNIYTPNYTGSYYTDTFDSVFKYYILRETAA